MISTGPEHGSVILFLVLCGDSFDKNCSDTLEVESLGAVLVAQLRYVLMAISDSVRFLSMCCLFMILGLLHYVRAMRLDGSMLDFILGTKARLFFLDHWNDVSMSILIGRINHSDYIQ